MGLKEAESPTDSGQSTPAPGQWIAGAKALAAFQAQHTGVAKGAEVTGGPRSGAKYASLTDILNVCKLAAEHGLSHNAEPRVLGDNSVVYRMVLNHESGESKRAELFIPFPPEVFIDKYGKEKRMQLGARFQELGGLITYARKYLLQGLYGLYADDGMDPDEDSYDYSKQVVQPSAKPVVKSINTPEQQSAPPVPSPAQVEKAMNAVVQDSNTSLPITPDAKDNALRILKKDPKAKAAFLAKFYPSKPQLIAADVNTMEHAHFLDEHELATAPF